MPETNNTEIELDLGLKDQLAITILTGIVGLVTSRLVEKTYVGAKTRYVRNRAAANTQ